MREIGLFEAKTKLSALCAEVAERGEGMMITRRGRPWVRLEPLEAAETPRATVWAERDRLDRGKGVGKKPLPLPGGEGENPPVW